MDYRMLEQTKSLLPVERFEAEGLREVHGLAAWTDACLNARAPDSVLHHAPGRLINILPRGIGAAIHWFGVDRGWDQVGVYSLAPVSSVSLGGAVFDPQSRIIFSPARGAFGPSCGDFDARHPAAPGRSEAIVTPIAGGQSDDIRHFLYKGLPAAMMLRGMLGPGLPVVGPVLLAWQAELLTASGLDQDYQAMTAPTAFSRIITSDLIGAAMPSRFARAALDRLRFRFGQTGPRTRRLLVGGAEAAGMVGWPEIEAAALEFAFETVDLAGLGIAEQARLFASATAVIGWPGRAMAMVGFCDPGTVILELHHEPALDHWTQVLAAAFGLEWYGFGIAGLSPAGEADETAGVVDRPALRACLTRMVGSA